MRTSNRAQIAQIAEQIGSSLMPDSDRYINRFTIDSTSSSKTYVVSQDTASGNRWCCGCTGWINHRHCKHLKDILRRLANLSEQTVASLNDEAREMLASARTAYLDLSHARPMVAPKASASELIF
jgi:hypothetical protein